MESDLSRLYIADLSLPKVNSTELKIEGPL